ncbi:cache domain-containing protein [Aliarcobacter lanthieri]|uniref:cache domain-containing protein n=1 Tax=Aliarcobacter lanthieri TaxID=1355374 RepID=UPI00047C51FF|nr:cache domain-containing protein [Aliarcobacter lanthieri]QKF58547.1 Cache sensor-containing two-component system histidine kinase [Aliarcobacter lanthieri]
MNYSIENNLSKIIISTSIIIMSAMIFAISYFYVQNTYDDFEHDMDKFVKDYYDEEKKGLKKEVNTVIDILNYNIAKSNVNDEILKHDAIQLLNNINFETNKSNYFFVYEIDNMEGGDDFAKMVVNPNRPDLVGTKISTNYEDADGKKFRDEFMSNIRENGESYSIYSYKKPDITSLQYKLSYFKYFDRFNWVIALGVYTDDIESKIALKKVALENKIKKQINQNIVLFLMFLTVAIVVLFTISYKIDDILKKYEEKVRKYANDLETLNANLEKEIKTQIKESREKEQILIQKSKFIALGEMISNIAHQWRQPLSELSSIFMFIKFKYDLDALDKKTMQIKSNEATKVLEYMSQTIDDFRNFFLPKKDKEEFYLYKAINSVISIVASGLSNSNIVVEIDIKKDILLKTFLNEYQQVILNILKNAQDILIEKDIKNPIIKIYAKDNDHNTILFIEDNGGGILVEPKNKIFEPYFTTKDKSNGTGIGLYMSKIIVEKNMKGKLKVDNISFGARFSIYIPKEKSKS